MREGEAGQYLEGTVWYASCPRINLVQMGSVLQNLRTDAKMTVCEVLEQTAYSCKVNCTSRAENILEESSTADDLDSPSETTAGETTVINLPSAK
jgi:hypothetical protein